MITATRYLLLFIPWLLVTPISAQTGNEESICTISAVIFCDNFEDRAIGSPGFTWPATYKNGGWLLSANGSSVNPQVVSTPTFAGSRALRLTTPANQASGGAVDSVTWAAGAQTTVYIRVYSMRSPNYILSPVSVKGFHTRPDTNNGLFSYLSGNWQPILFSYKASPTTLNQNVNLPAVTVTPGQWYCFEVRLTRSTGGTDGTVEGWIDGIKKWNYPGIAFDTNDTYTGLLIVSYWNCTGVDADDCSPPASAHPEMYHYYDNIVVSTQPIGCLGAPAGPPTAPSGLTITQQ